MNDDLVFEIVEGWKMSDAKRAILEVYAPRYLYEFSICKGDYLLPDEEVLNPCTIYRVTAKHSSSRSVIAFGLDYKIKFDVFWPVRFVVEFLEKMLMVRGLILVKNGVPFDRDKLFCFDGFTGEVRGFGTVDETNQGKLWHLSLGIIRDLPEKGEPLHFSLPDGRTIVSGFDRKAQFGTVKSQLQQAVGRKSFGFRVGHKLVDLTLTVHDVLVRLQTNNENTCSNQDIILLDG
jgi:hypothetical protein